MWGFPERVPRSQSLSSYRTKDKALPGFHGDVPALCSGSTRGVLSQTEKT